MSLRKKELQEALRNGIASLVRQSTVEVKDEIANCLEAKEMP